MRRLHHLVQHAVNAEADAQALLLRFDVDVAGPVAHRLVENEVGQLHRRFFRDIAGRFLFHHFGDGIILLLDGGAGARILLDGYLEFAVGNAYRLDIKTGQQPQIVNGDDILGVHHGHHQAPLFKADGQGLVAPRRFRIDEGGGGAVNFIIFQGYELHPGLAGNSPGNGLFGAVAQLDQGLAEQPPGALAFLLLVIL